MELDEYIEALEEIQVFLEKTADDRTYAVEQDSFPYEYWGQSGWHTTTDHTPNEWSAKITIDSRGWDEDDLGDFKDEVVSTYTSLPFCEGNEWYSSSNTEEFDVSIEFRTEDEGKLTIFFRM